MFSHDFSPKYQPCESDSNSGAETFPTWEKCKRGMRTDGGSIATGNEGRRMAFVECDGLLRGMALPVILWHLGKVWSLCDMALLTVSDHFALCMGSQNRVLGSRLE